MPPVTSAMAAERSITRYQLFSDQYQQLFRGVFVPRAEPLDLRTWVQAARLVLPDDAVITGLTALQLGGLDLGQPLPLRFAIDRQVRSRSEGINLVRRSGLRSIGGCVTNVDALAEVCRTNTLMESVVIIDRALHLRLITRSELGELARLPDGAIQQACGLARIGAESVRETKLRLCMTAAGLPEPALQVELDDEFGWIGRFDMVVADQRLIIEYDGDQHRTDKQQWTRDITRLERARKSGYGVVQVTAQLFTDPWGQACRIHQELADRGYEGPRPERSALWEQLFGRPHPSRQR